VNLLDRADAYLTIPPAYGAALGGVGWSAGCDAVERADGSTLAVAEEIGLVLEGVFARPPVPHFAFVLHLLGWMKAGREWASEATARLRRAYAAARGTVGAGRHPG